MTNLLAWALDENSSQGNILDQLSSLIFILHRDGTIGFANRAAACFSGCDQQSLHGARFEHYFSLETGRGDTPPLEIAQIFNNQLHLLGHDLVLGTSRAAESLRRLPVRCGSHSHDNDCLLLVLDDVRAELNLRKQLEQQGRRDPLTGLLNRQALETELQRHFQRAQAEQASLSLLLFDTDRVKLINDSFGHATGDEILINVSRLAMETLRPLDLMGRWSGHEFLCILPATQAAEARDLADEIRHRVRHSDQLASNALVRATISAGVTGGPAAETSAEQMLRSAGDALYRAKREGRNRVVAQPLGQDSIFLTAAQVQAAISENRLLPAFQPIVDLQSGAIVADEALARIRCKDDRLMPAGSFIEAASELQLAHLIDHSIIRQTMDRCQITLDPQRPLAHFVNISADLLRHPKRVDDLLQHAHALCSQCATDFDGPKPLVIEITERELLGDPQEALRILKPFLDFGLRLAIDDFGSGYSSFQYLADLPISFLKIEGELIRRISTEPRIRAIVQGIQDTASALDLITIAEFVEDEETVKTLREIGVDWAQGYYFGKPRTDLPSPRERAAL